MGRGRADYEAGEVSSVSISPETLRPWTSATNSYQRRYSRHFCHALCLFAHAGNMRYLWIENEHYVCKGILFFVQVVGHPSDFWFRRRILRFGHFNKCWTTCRGMR